MFGTVTDQFVTPGALSIPGPTLRWHRYSDDHLLERCCAESIIGSATWDVASTVAPQITVMASPRKQLTSRSAPCLAER
jgi:hypothetical protein